MGKVCSYRFDEETARKLRECSSFYKMSPSAFLALKIRQEYEYINGNPSAQKALELFEQLTALTEELELCFK